MWRSRFGRCGIALAVCAAIAGVVPTPALGNGWTDFIPTPYQNRAFLDVFGAYERDDNRAAEPRVKWTDTFLRERLTLESNGYSYHPRFMQYQFSLGGVARQEEYEHSLYGSRGWRQGNGVEYQARLYFLPEHPYNLDIYGARYEPLYKEQGADSHNTVETTKGAIFRYRKKPYFAHASYGDESIESDQSRSDVRRVSVGGEYLKRFHDYEATFTASANPSWFDNSSGVDGTTQEYLLSNYLNLKQARLNSYLSLEYFDQSSPSSGDMSNDQLSWDEILTVNLPWRFRGDVYYRYQDNQSSFDAPGQLYDREMGDQSQDVKFDLVHRLYESVDTTYMLFDNRRDSYGGQSDALTHSVSVNYAKSIPTGRYLAGISWGTTDMDSSGEADIPFEPHSAKLNSWFRLTQQNIDPDSLAVFVRARTGEMVPLYEHENYAVNALAGDDGNWASVEILVFSVPPDLMSDNPDHVYDFFVTYSLTTGDFGMRTDSLGANTSLELLDNLLTPYFSYVKVNSDVLYGDFPGTPVDATTYTAGLMLHFRSLRARGEYQDVDWEASPYRSWRAEIQWIGALTATTNVYATAYYLNKHYPNGTTSSYSEPYTEETESFSASLQKTFFSRNLHLAVGGSYSRIDGLVESQVYAGNATCMWRIGKLDITAGATAYEAESSGWTTTETKRDHEFFYLKFRRQLY